jgi:putative SOS response-associated peptidase YedK
MINARAETLAQKPAFREAFRLRRCLVPADGFFEWQKSGTKRLPFLFRLRDESLFAFAGLWELKPPGLETFTIITCDANELVDPIHPRMPVILPPEKFAQWLDSDATETALRSCLRSFPASSMKADAVSTRVNSPLNDSPECIRPFPNQGRLL